MALIGFPFATTRLDCINRILVANSTAVIAMSCIIDPHGCRIIPIGIIVMANGRAGVLGLVVHANGHAHIVGHTIFPNGHAVFLGIGLVPDGYRGPSLSRHIAAQSHGIGGVDEPRNSQKRGFYIVSLLVPIITSIWIFHILWFCSNLSIFQKIISSILISR